MLTQGIQRIISIHAPAWGAIRYCYQGGRQYGFQSTPPHGERPHQLLRHRCLLPYFNPRPPHGERRLRRYTVRPDPHFNPRPPHGERLGMMDAQRRICQFQSTPPRMGSDKSFARSSSGMTYFNPRPPHGERHAELRRRHAR